MNMTGTAPVQDSQSRKALEAFVTDNPELERLEGLLAQFNIFEAIGAVRHEVRHSDFLAYLLNPQENHGLGDSFIKRLLQKAIASAGGADLPVTLIDLDFWDLGTATVQREWQRIDIFLRDETHQFSVIIENKIDTGEHDDQLARYYERVGREFPNDRILALYLTKEGDDPSDDRYIPVGYDLICETVEHLAERRASTLGSDVRTLMAHYTQMLRRHIMSETEVARLCKLIYQKHKTALDLIYDHRPDQQSAISEYVAGLIQQQTDIRLIRRLKTYIYFEPTEWVSLIPRLGTDWFAAGPILYFAFENGANYLTLKLMIGPGPADTRQKLLDFALQQSAFKPSAKTLNKSYNNVLARPVLKAVDYEASAEDIEIKVEHFWKHFVGHDLPPIIDAIVQRKPFG